MNFQFILNNFNFIAEGCLITIVISAVSFLIALIISILTGTLLSGPLPFSIEKFLKGFIEIFRGTPLLIQLFFIYYGLPSIGITMDSYTAAVIGLSLHSGAYMSESVRASLMSVERGQYEAASSLGMNRMEILLHIIYPQAFRIALPVMMNSFSALLKESSLVSVLAITELTRAGQLIYTRTYRPFEVYITIGVIYFIMTYSVSRLSRVMERSLNRHKVVLAR
ncbi:MAG TPA: amino acid ABC transporter permease [Spirochaetota bacterium]|nr:amino acid ABC transporter permease [Spirochaetota bacterium]